MRNSRRALVKLVLTLAVIGTVWTSPVFAEPEGQYSFSAIWKLVEARAPDISAAGHELEAARINEVRMSRHWYPRVYLEGRAFSTNDPAQNFISLLGQRQIALSDFAPQALNQPGSNFFEHGTLGIDFPVFEGGAKVAAFEGSQKMVKAKSFEERLARLSEYVSLAGAYSSVLTLQNQRREMINLGSNIDETLARYKIGSKSNPVGYSGLLGLRSLRNRIEGQIAENSAKTEALRSRIRITAKTLPENWMPLPEDPKHFIGANLSEPNFANGSRPDAVSVVAMRLAAEALEKNRDAESARFLPKVGLFGMGDLFSGSRSAQTSYTAGAYVQWDLLAAQNYGAVGQAEQVAAAAQARANGMSERTEIERAASHEAAKGLEKNLSLMDENTKLIEEQTTTARTLFRNGSINALQFVEVLARKLDLLVSRAEAEMNLAQAKTKLLLQSGAQEVPHEN